MNKFKILAITLGMVFAVNASAETYTYTFGDKISRSGPDVTDFATLTFNDVSSNFVLTLSDSFSSLFGSNAYVRSLAIDYGGTGPDPVVTGAVSGGVHTVTTSSNNLPDGGYDFRYVFGNGNDKLTSGEFVSWSSDDLTRTWRDDGHKRTFTVAAFDVAELDNAALGVQGLPRGKNGWYELSAVTPIPEPESYALLLAGLSLVGFIGTRKRRSQE